MGSNIVEEIRKTVEQLLEGSNVIDSHGWEHILRVHKIALRVALATPDVNIEEVEITSLLHDIGRTQESGLTPWHAEESYKMAVSILEPYKNRVDTQKILNIVRYHAQHNPSHPIRKCIEFKILQDADLIDAFGPVGIMRDIFFPGHNSIREQLDYLKEKASDRNYLLQTEEGKRIGQRYKEYLKKFLENYNKQAEGLL